MSMKKAFLLADTIKESTIIILTNNGAIANFNAAGGYAYIGRDYFAYTGIAGDSFTGCTDLHYSHKANEEVTPWYGIRLEDVIAPAELENDSEGVTSALLDMIEVMRDEIKRKALRVNTIIDPVECDPLFLKYICTNLGLEFNENMSEEIQRCLAMNSTAALKWRGTVNAFKFMAYHVLGYKTEVTVESLKIPMILGDPNYRMYKPPTELAASDKTTGLWLFTEGAGINVANEISGGANLVLQNVAMWNAYSMFLKDLSITLDNVHHYALIDGSVASSANLHGKEQFNIKFFMNPDVSAIFPQQIMEKDILFVIYRHNANGLTITMTDGVVVKTLAVENCITVVDDNFISILFDRPDIVLLVDGIEVGRSHLFDIDIIDLGNDIQIGDDTNVAPYYGKFDTLEISVGKEYETETINYYNHIRILKTYEQDPDENCYIYSPDFRDGFITIFAGNSEGNMEKMEILRYLIAEWLGAGDSTITTGYNLPIEQSLGWF